MEPLDILTFGEPLYELVEAERDVERIFRPGIGGDTSNVGIAAARQGAKVGVFAHLGADAFGRAILDLWDQEAIDHATVRSVPGQPTGLYFVSYGPDGHAFTYRRAGSAASRVAPADLPLGRIATTRLLHVSGISQAISDSAADSVFAAIRHARAHGVRISYDTNFREALWPLDRARAVIHAAIANVDVARPGLDDARRLTGLQAPGEIADFYLGLGCGLVAMTLGVDGVLVADRNGQRLVPARRVEALDATGAGDCFGGAFLAEWLRHGDAIRAAEYGNAAAALKTLGQGAVAPIPRKEDVERFLVRDPPV